MDRTSEKEWVKSEYVLHECPRCSGSGLEPMSVFTYDTCRKCNGDGTIVKECGRSKEGTSHRERCAEDEHRNKWLFS